MNFPLAIQSYCFRNFKPLPQLCEQLKAAGVTATELCGVHADFTKPQTFAQTIAALKTGGITLTSIGVEYLSGDPAIDRPRFEFCRQAGIKHLAISFKPQAMFDGIAQLERLAEEFDLQLGIHNHGGYDWLGNPPILEYLFSKTTKRIGLHLDTAWAIDAKQNAVEMAEKFIDRLCGIHVKDFVYNRARQPSDVIIGTGNLDLPKLMSTLKAGGFSGPIVIEYEGDITNPNPALVQCVSAIQPLLQ